jgi:(2Fe-2S) ferredoxin
VPTFKRHIFVCMNQRSADDPRGSCSKLGSEALHAHFKSEAKRVNLKDVVRANKAGCLDHCAQGPSVVIYPEGVWYSVKTESDVTEIMERHVVNGEVVTRLLMPDHPAPVNLLPLHSLH